MGINREEKLDGRLHDREDIFPGENNSSYTHTKPSGKKMSSRKLGRISGILRIAGGSADGGYA
jgi:hypothetical protein